MKIFIIGQIVNGNQVVGYRLLDIDDKNQVRDYSCAQISQVLGNDKTKDIIQNAKLVNGVITGTNGQLSRYPKISTNGMLLTTKDKSPLIIINKIEDLGYTVSDFKGQVTKMKNSDAVAYAKQYGIANGKVVTQDDVDYISSISDSYDEIKVSPSKLGSKGKLNINLHLEGNASSIAKHTENDINTELQYNDVFAAMTPDQRSVLKQFYTWYTVKVYKGLAKNVRLNLAPGKAEKLAQLRGIEKWKFAGVNDSYLEKRFDAKCELGHSLRYEYFAIPEDDTEDLSARTRDWSQLAFRTTNGAQDDLRERGAIVFGETCAGDFFNIAPEDMKKLVKTRKTMSEEIELMADVITNNLEKMYYNKCRFLYECIRELNKPEIVALVFGQQVGYTLIAFIRVQMPFPKSLVLLASEEARKNKELFLKNVFKSHTKIIDKILTNDVRSNRVLGDFNKLFDYLMDYTIEGDYQYDPLNDKENSRRDIGAYNKDTRAARDYTNRVLYSITTLNQADTESVANINALLEILEKASVLSNDIVKYIDNSEVLQEEFKSNTLRSEKKYFIDKLKNFGDNVENISNEYLNGFNIMMNALSLDAEYGYRNEFCLKLTSYYTRYRSKGRYKSFEELKTAYQTAGVGVDNQKIIDESLGLYVKSREKELDKLKEEELNKPKYYRITLKEDTKTKELYGNIPCIYRDTRQSRDMITKIMNHESVEQSSFTGFEDLTVLVSDIESVEIITESIYASLRYDANIKLSARKREEKQREEEKLAELERQKEEEKQKKLEQEKKERFQADTKMMRLKDILDKHKEEDDDYGLTVARSILNREQTYGELSSKQQWRVDDTIKRFGGDTEGKDESTQENSLPTKYKLADSKEVNDKVEKLYEILKGKDKEAYNKVVKASRIAFDIVKTVKFKGEYSDKQLKHIDKAYEAIK